MTKPKLSSSAWETALDCLSRRALTSNELETRLKKKGFKDIDIDRTLMKLKDFGYLNDWELALMYSQSRLKRYSRRRVFYDLKNRGLAPQIIEQVIEETYSRDEEFRQCLVFAEQWWEQEDKRWQQKYKEKPGAVPRELWIQQKLSRRLFQRGYSSDMVRSALNTVQNNG